MNRRALLIIPVVTIVAAGCGHDDPRTIRLASPDGATPAQLHAAAQAVIARVGLSEEVGSSEEGEVVVRLLEQATESRAQVVRRMTAPGLLTLGVAADREPVLGRGDFAASPKSGRDAHGRLAASLGFSGRGARRFAVLMHRHAGERVPLWLAIDGRVVSRWTMKAPKSWNDSIGGLLNVAPMRTRELAAQVDAFGRSGPLPVPLHVVG